MHTVLHKWMQELDLWAPKHARSCTPAHTLAQTGQLTHGISAGAVLLSSQPKPQLCAAIIQQTSVIRKCKKHIHKIQIKWHFSFVVFMEEERKIEEWVTKLFQTPALWLKGIYSFTQQWCILLWSGMWFLNLCDVSIMPAVGRLWVTELWFCFYKDDSESKCWHTQKRRKFTKKIGSNLSFLFKKKVFPPL